MGTRADACGAVVWRVVVVVVAVQLQLLLLLLLESFQVLDCLVGGESSLLVELAHVADAVLLLLLLLLGWRDMVVVVVDKELVAVASHVGLR